MTITDRYLYHPIPWFPISKASKSNFLTGLLRTFVDPRSEKGTISSKEYRLLSLIEFRKTKLIIVDGMNFWIDRYPMNIYEETKNLIRSLSYNSGTTWILLTEIPGSIEVTFVSANMLPFKWDDENLQMVADYCIFLQAIESALPFKKPSNLFEDETAWRIFFAADGFPYSTVKLIKQASKIAIKGRRECITLPDLSDAFMQSANDRENTFNGDIE